MRKCSKCAKTLPEENFWRQLSRADGLQAACIDCMTISHKKWRKRLSAGDAKERTRKNLESVRRGRERDPIGLLLRSIKGRAKNQGREFDLSREDIVIPDVCPVLGIPLKFGVRRGRGLKERDQRPSVDRVDNDKGYTRDNIVIVSYRANRIKSDATLEELEAVAKFYRGVNDDRIRHIEEHGCFEPEVARQPREVPLSRVQSRAKEEVGPVLERDENDGGDLGLLPSLRMVVRGRV